MNDTDIQDIYAKQHLQGMYSGAFYKFKDWIFRLIVTAYFLNEWKQHDMRLPPVAFNS